MIFLKNIIFRRVIAFFIDLFIVSVITSFLASIPFINPEKARYEESYNRILEIFEQYKKEEITIEEYETKFISLSYDLNRMNLSFTIINIVVIIGYFVIFQWQRKGRTIGKQLMRLQVVSVKDEKEVPIFSYLLRSIVLNNLMITIVQMIILYTVNKENYYVVYNNLNLVGYILLYITIFLVLLRMDKRGLHDFVAGTKVIDLLEETKPNKRNKVTLERQKEDETKSTTSKKE